MLEARRHDRRLAVTDFLLQASGLWGTTANKSHQGKA
jgi:hypothetical protein